MDWKEALRNPIPKSSVKLRHNLDFVRISDIAEQYYCEQKVELSFKIGEIDTHRKQIGAQIHEELIPMEKAEREHVLREIESRPSYICSIPLYFT